MNPPRLYAARLWSSWRHCLIDAAFALGVSLCSGCGRQPAPKLSPVVGADAPEAQAARREDDAFLKAKLAEEAQALRGKALEDTTTLKEGHHQ